MMFDELAFDCLICSLYASIALGKCSAVLSSVYCKIRTRLETRTKESNERASN